MIMLVALLTLGATAASLFCVWVGGGWGDIYRGAPWPVFVKRQSCLGSPTVTILPDKLGPVLGVHLIQSLIFLCAYKRQLLRHLTVRTKIGLGAICVTWMGLL